MYFLDPHHLPSLIPIICNLASLIALAAWAVFPLYVQSSYVPTVFFGSLLASSVPEFPCGVYSGTSYCMPQCNQDSVNCLELSCKVSLIMWFLRGQVISQSQLNPRGTTSPPAWLLGLLRRASSTTTAR